MRRSRIKHQKTGKNKILPQNLCPLKFQKKKDNNDTELKISNAQVAQFSQWIALYVVDGKKMDKDFDPDGIDPNKIESIQVILGPKAIEKYGKEASEGVIEIIIKK